MGVISSGVPAGPAAGTRVGGVGGGGDSDNDVWEIRILVTKSSVPGLAGLHGSIFVQDNGKGSGVDFADENFDPARLFEDACGVTTSFQLEPVLQGSITVRDETL